MAAPATRGGSVFIVHLISFFKSPFAGLGIFRVSVHVEKKSADPMTTPHLKQRRRLHRITQKLRRCTWLRYLR